MAARCIRCISIFGAAIGAFLPLRPALAAEEEPQGSRAPAREASETEDEGYTESVTIEEVMPEDPGEIALRLSVEASRTPEAAVSGPDRWLLPRFQGFFGITKWLTVDASVPLVLVRENENHYGLGDVELGLKVLLLESEGAVPSLVFLAESSLPTGSEAHELGEGHAEIGGALGFVSLPDPLIIQGSVGYALTTGVVEHDMEYGLSLGVPVVSDRFFAFVEGSGVTSLSEKRTALSLGPAIKLYLASELYVAAGTTFGLTASSDDYRALLQVQYAF